MEKLDIISNKIYSRETILNLCASWRLLGKKIVFTNGCFDLVHLGHVEYLSKAADFGHLVIGVNTDASVRRLKGPHRPINDEQSRAMVLASFLFVNAVVLFDEDTPYELIRSIQPDILVKGNDYKAEEIVGYDIVKSRGGEVVTIELTQGYSSTKIEERIISLHRK